MKARKRKGKAGMQAQHISDFRPGVDKVVRDEQGRAWVVDTQGCYAPIEVTGDTIPADYEARLAALPPEHLWGMYQAVAKTPYLSEEGREERLRVLRRKVSFRFEVVLEWGMELHFCIDPENQAIPPYPVLYQRGDRTQIYLIPDEDPDMIQARFLDTKTLETTPLPPTALGKLWLQKGWTLVEIKGAPCLFVIWVAKLERGEDRLHRARVVVYRTPAGDPVRAAQAILAYESNTPGAPLPDPCMAFYVPR